MSKSCLPYDPDRQLLMPSALQEWLPEDHLAYVISKRQSMSFRPMKEKEAQLSAEVAELLRRAQQV